MEAGREVSRKSIRVLRLGFRFVRDDRTITHLCLVSRALGAEAILLEEVEPDLLKTVQEVNQTWGGSFGVEEARPWSKVIKAAKDEGRKVVHLTMYGLPIEEKMEEMRREDSFLVVVGGPKVPRDVYTQADYNIAVTSQPHSEIAALAIFLHELQEGKELKGEFPKSRLKIVPQDRGKRVTNNQQGSR